MLPSFYQVSLAAHLNEIQFVTLPMLVELLQNERRVSLERLATLFAQPILFESRRRNLQRFLNLPIISPQNVVVSDSLGLGEATLSTTDSGVFDH